MGVACLLGGVCLLTHDNKTSHPSTSREAERHVRLRAADWSLGACPPTHNTPPSGVSTHDHTRTM